VADSDARKFREAIVIAIIVLTLLFLPQYLRERWYGPVTPTVVATSGFFEVSGKPLFIFGGEVHYFRVPKALWYDRLLKAKRAGLNTIASYIAWNWHEPREGLLLFRDAGAGGFYENSAFSRDLEGYMELARELGLYFIARPGPYICSEWDSGGHPNWLYRRVNVLRSLDPAYISQAERWYGTVLPLIARRSVSRSGPVIMVQVENEYFWGDAPYLIKLYEIARRYVTDLPIVTNEDWHVEGTPIVNTIDDYPSPWDIAGFDGKVRSYVKTQPGMPKMHMELEGGWFTTFGGPLPTNRGSFPSQWTETLIKTTIGLGVNAVNIYMFHGGTNPGYYTGKHITTSYDYEAAISEWGYLRERYYAIKRTALFTRSFNDLLVSTKTAEGFVQVSEPGVDVFSRVGGRGEALVVLRNLADRHANVKLRYKGEVIPYSGSIRAPARNAKFVVLNYTIEGTPFRLVYTASEPLLKVVEGGEALLVVYGDPGEEGGLAVASKENVNVEYASGFSIEKRDERTIVARCVHGEADSIAVLSSGGSTLTVVATSRFRAERTWLIDEYSRPIVLISNVYFVGEASVEGGRFKLELELDERSGGPLLIYSPQPLVSALIDGAVALPTRIYGRLYRLELSAPTRTEPSVSTGVWSIKREESRPQGEPVELGTPLEEVGLLDNGYATYVIRFNLKDEELSGDRTLYVSYFNDFASAILNGVHLGSAYHSIEVDASGALRPGENELVVVLESLGHPNDGLLYVPNGIVGGIYLGKVREEELRGWLRVGYSIPYGPSFSFSSFLHMPEQLEQLLNDPNLEQKGEGVESVSDQGFYVKRFRIDKIEGRYILEFSGRAPLFVNKRYLGVYTGPIDVTDYLVVGENEIALLWDRAVAWWQTPRNPILKIYRAKLSGECFVAAGTLGLANGWYREEVDEAGWTPAKLPLELRNSGGSIVWLRGTFTVNVGERVRAPLKLKVEARGVRMLIYFNGQFVGRFASEGPQTEFYIPEPLVRNGLNNLAIMVHITGSEAGVTSLSLEPFYTHALSTLELTSE